MQQRLEQELRDGRQHAENMKFLEDSERQFNDTQSSPAHSTPRHPHDLASAPQPTGLAQYAQGGDQNPSGGRLVSDGIIAGLGPMAPPPTWPWSGEKTSLVSDRDNTLAITPNTVSTPSSDSRTDRRSLQYSPPIPNHSKKRHRDSTGSSNEQVAKSVRATPSPAVTGTTTPSSLDSFDIPEDSELFRLLGDPKQDMREMKKEQKAQEAALRARREQEAKDEAFARALASLESPEPPSSRAGPSNLYRTPTQTFFDSRGEIQRPEPQIFPTTPSIKSSPSSHFTQGPGHFTFGSPSPAKYEQPFTQSIQTPKTSDFIDLDDEENDFVDLTGLPSSDHVERGPNEYGGQGQASNQRQLPWLNAESQIPIINGVGGFSDQSLSLNGAGHSGWGNIAGQVLQSGMDVIQNVYDVGHNFLNPQNSGYSSDSAYINGYGAAGSSSNPISFGDEEFSGLNGHHSAYNALSARINVNDPRNQELVNQYMDRVDHMSHDPRRTAEDIKSLLENIRPDEELSPEDREGTPDAMTVRLMPHQLLGLAWLKKMEEGSSKGGILSDDMGLGKTIQALALMVSRRSQDPNRKTTLIIAPVALMRQWEKEIRTRLKSGREHRLTTFIMHGAHRSATWEHLKSHDVVLTTFGTLATELKRKQGIDMAKRANPNWRPTGKADQLPLLGDNCKWYRVIIDEAQCIKNKNTHAAIAASHLQSLSRFCMTGTPMMNNVGELYSLIRFLRIKPYDVSERFNRDFTAPLKRGERGDTAKAMRMLQALLKAILLRRTKKSMIDGKPILSLPERTTETQHAMFNDDERDFYRAVETKTQLQFNRYLKAGTVGRHYSNILVLLLRLRQACCHPHLLKDFGQSTGATELTMEEMIEVAKQLAPDVIARLQEQTGTEELNGLECPICMDTAENSLIIIPCGHGTCSECFARITDPSQAIANGDTDGASNDIKCPSCRGKIDLKKVINHEAFKKAHMPGLDLGITAQEEDGDDDSDEAEDDSQSESEDQDTDSDASNSLRDFIVDDEVDDDETTDDSENEAEGYRKGKTPFEKSAKSGNKLKKVQKGNKGKGKAKVKATGGVPKRTLAELKKEGQRNLKARKRYINRLRKEYIPSAKIDKAIEILRATQESKEGEKTIVFSQFTSLLDLLEVPIDAEGWKYKRYDGSMSAKARDLAVTEFTDKPDCKVMLVSLKAGNAGLNLVAASNVIIFDPFWNPYIEEQAIDRAHRIGQLRPVKVHRILVPDTVEDRILALQEKKRELIEGALDEKASQNIARLGTRELAFLFVSFLPTTTVVFDLLTKLRGCPIKGWSAEAGGTLFDLQLRGLLLILVVSGSPTVRQPQRDSYPVFTTFVFALFVSVNESIMFLSPKNSSRAVSYISLLVRNSVTGIFRDTPLLAQAALIGTRDVGIVWHGLFI